MIINRKAEHRGTPGRAGTERLGGYKQRTKTSHERLHERRSIRMEQEGEASVSGLQPRRNRSTLVTPTAASDNLNDNRPMILWQPAGNFPSTNMRHAKYDHDVSSSVTVFLLLRLTPSSVDRFIDSFYASIH